MFMLRAIGGHIRSTVEDIARHNPRDFARTGLGYGLMAAGAAGTAVAVEAIAGTEVSAVAAIGAATAIGAAVAAGTISFGGTAARTRAAVEPALTHVPHQMP
jgi:hypothetical protein